MKKLAGPLVLSLLLSACAPALTATQQRHLAAFDACVKQRGQNYEEVRNWLAMVLANDIPLPDALEAIQATIKFEKGQGHNFTTYAAAMAARLWGDPSLASPAAELDIGESEKRCLTTRYGYQFP